MSSSEYSDYNSDESSVDNSSDNNTSDNSSDSSEKRRKYHQKIDKCLRDYNDFIEIANTGNIDLIGVALECSAIDKFVVRGNMDALCYAIFYGNYRIVKLLISGGFHPDRLIKTNTHKHTIQGERPLFFIYGSYINYTKIIKCLVKNGANLNAPDYYCKICNRDGLFCSDEFSHRCNNDVNNLCRDGMIKALCGQDEKIVDAMIDNGYNYKNRRLITYLTHPRCGIFFNNWNTMYRLYSIDENYFYEELSRDGYFASECKKYKSVLISYKGSNMTLESFYKYQTKKHHGLNIVSLLIAAYYYDDNWLLSRDYLCLDMFKLIIKEYTEQLLDLSDP